MGKYNLSLDLQNENNSHTKILGAIAPNSTVLEFGPAHGTLTEYMRDQLNCAVYIVEIDEADYSEAIKFAVDGVCCDASKLEWLATFANVKFDYIIFSDVLEHLYDPANVLKHAMSLLKEDGYVLVSVPNIAHNSIIINLIENKFEYRKDGLLDNTHIRFFTYTSLHELLDVVGLMAVVEDATYLHPRQTEFGNDYENVQGNTDILKRKHYEAVYQFVFSAVKKDYYYQNRGTIDTQNKIHVNVTSTDSESIITSFLYLDTGDGFNESEIITLSTSSRHVRHEVELPQGVQSLRFDPIENVPCIVENIKILSDTGYLPLVNVNGYAVGDYHVFLTRDSQFNVIEFPQGVSWISIEADVYPCSQPMLVGLFACVKELLHQKENHLVNLSQENETLQLTFAKNIDELKAEILSETKALEEQTAMIERLIAESEHDKNTLRQENEAIQQALRQENEAIQQVLRQENETLQRAFTKDINELKAEILERKNTEEEQVTVIETLTATAMHYEQVKKDLIQHSQELSEEVLRHKHTKKELDQCSLELFGYQTHYHEAIAQRDDARIHAANYLYQLQVMHSSSFWRITKPARVVVGGVKWFFRSFPLTRLAYKGLWSLRRHGIRATMASVKNWGSPPVYMSVNANTPDDVDTPIKEPDALEERVKFSIIVPFYNPPVFLLRELIKSVQAQTYSNWELCLAGWCHERSSVERVLESYAQADSRIKYKFLEENLGISGNSNEAIKMSHGDYIALCDQDDIIFPNALYENALAIQETNADVLYSDENHVDENALAILCADIDVSYFNQDHIDESGSRHFFPFFKPDWSRDLLYSQMYICHFLVIKRNLLDKAGWFDSAFDGSQDYDLMLRLSEHTEAIHHIPKVLYSWRQLPTSTSVNADSKPYAQDAGLNALNAHLSRFYDGCASANLSSATFVYDTRFDTMVDTPKVSIIIPMKDKHELTNSCIESIIEKSTYTNWEIILLNNRSAQKETRKWFETITLKESRVKVIDANFKFNWSKLNNFGMQHSDGDVYIFLNNDTVVITPDWIERLCENALREDIGVVGPLLLYEDETIQHAGVIVGMNDWADHIFKGMQPVHITSPYVSPMVNRNVLSVTGACLCVSRKTAERLGGFNEDFIICGSDVEFCIRAYDIGLNNMYNANVKLYHLESKSRDSFVPEIDFKLSYEAYTPYRENIDPYFNPNLDIRSTIPIAVSGGNMNFKPFKNFLKRNPLTHKLAASVLKMAKDATFDVKIAETAPIIPRVDKKLGNKSRLNLLIPSITLEHVFGGISTAINFFQLLHEKLGSNARIIVTDSITDKNNCVTFTRFNFVDCDIDSTDPNQIIEFTYRDTKTLPVGEGDVFIATAWWTAYNIDPVIRWQRETFPASKHPLLYIIQDFEPNFYPWSTRYLMADSTYKRDLPIVAVFNTKLLQTYFNELGYSFEQEYFFDPTLNEKLKAFLLDGNMPPRKKQIIIYGRPSVARNALELIVIALRQWANQHPNAHEWNILSIGEHHPDIELKPGVILKSLGKLKLDEYALIMKESYMGISLMVSPHPSYPPLEMSTFGVKTITNGFANKDLSVFNENIISLETADARSIAKTLTQLADRYSSKSIPSLESAYVLGVDGDSSLFEICNKIANRFF